jgi:crotonobetainyl-CoA:carnitine CoA-transferase CaiB-like acyl-CoA transferase
MTARTGSLRDLIVLDLSGALAGPHATTMLGDLRGTLIIKVEALGRGDDTGGWGPRFRWPGPNGHQGSREATDETGESPACSVTGHAGVLPS